MMPLARFLLALSLGSALAAQSRPGYTLAPVTPLGGQLTALSTSSPGAPYLHLLDTRSSRLELAGETLWLGLSPALLLLDSGVMPSSGQKLLSLPIPATSSLHGIALVGQVLLLSPTVPNGSFALSRPQTTALSSGRSFVAETFAAPSASGFTGDFDRSERDVLSPLPVQYREQRLLDSIKSGRAFGQSLAGPFAAGGVRMQWVLRSFDLAARRGESVVGIAWRPFQGRLNGPNRIARMRLELGHSKTVPDYTVDPFSALPKFPNSGLSTQFAANRPKLGMQLAFDSSYSYAAPQLRADGYVELPAFGQQFVYNGWDSILLDFFVPHSSQTQVQDGMQVWLPVLSMANPYSRAYMAGTVMAPRDPFSATQGQGDNTLPDLKIRFAKVASTAQSPFYAANVGSPDWQAPIILADVPAGCSVELEFQGSTTPNTSGQLTTWLPASQVDRQLDGWRHVRFRAHMIANGLNGKRPALHSVVVPIR